MSFLELFLLGVGLSMDAFAVSVCKGLATRKLSFSGALTAGAFFGGFQALMPLLGYLLGGTFSKYIAAVDHWIAFILLAAIGANMIREAIHDKDENINASFAFGEMLVLAIATSIDAFAVGVTFAFLEVNILQAITIIGTTTFCISAAGVLLGNFIGAKFGRWAKLAGGVVLILIGVHILLSHLGILG